MGPALIIDPTSGIFIGGLFGFILALPVSLFLAFWISAVKNRKVVVFGAFAGALLGFLVIQAWVGELIFDSYLPGADGVSTFFGSLFICSALGLAGAILTDLFVARQSRQDYRRPAVHE